MLDHALDLFTCAASPPQSLLEAATRMSRGVKEAQASAERRIIEAKGALHAARQAYKVL